jgi:hypothetical protein
MDATLEISPATKARLIEKYRYTNVDGSWWAECDLREFCEAMHAIGVRVDDARWGPTGKAIYYSISYSQGDGACFDGSVFDFALFLTAVGEKNPTLHAFAEKYWLFSWKCGGSYSHAHTAQFDDSEVFPVEDDMGPEDEFERAVWRVQMQDVNTDEVIKAMSEFLRGKMDELFHALRTTYEACTEDDAVWDTIIANDLHYGEEDEQ